jgi:integrase
MRGLTDTAIRNAKAKAKRYRLTDSHGLSIEISPASTASNPRKSWRYRYRLDGRENIFSPGDWCQAPPAETLQAAQKRRDGGRLTLAEARAARVTWRDLVKTGQHPRLVRAAQRILARQTATNTLEAVAREYIERHGKRWGHGYRRRFVAVMEGDIYPDLGALPIAVLRLAHVLPVLGKIEERGALTVVHAARGFLGRVFRYAVATEKIELDPMSALRREALIKVETEHNPILALDRIGPFLREIEKAGANRTTEIAIRLLLLTMLRSNELRGGWWPEVDFDAALWSIPPERMKGRLPHVVPLSTQATALLRELRALTGGPGLAPAGRMFPNVRRPREGMDGSTLLHVAKRAGYGGVITMHGFRGTAGTHLREAGFEDMLVELQLAHRDKNASRRAYNHSVQLPARRAMIQAWADMIDAAALVSPRVVG